MRKVEQIKERKEINMQKSIITIIICTFFGHLYSAQDMRIMNIHPQLINNAVGLHILNSVAFSPDGHYLASAISGINASYLMEAVKNEDVNEVKSLISKDANINHRYPSSRTVLIIAARKASRPIVKILIKANAKLNLQDKDGKTALMHAAEMGYPTITNMLVDAQANAQISNIFGENALHLAWYNAFFYSLAAEADKTPGLKESYDGTVTTLTKAIGLTQNPPMTIQELFNVKEIPKVIVSLIFSYLKKPEIELLG